MFDFPKETPPEEELKYARKTDKTDPKPQLSLDDIIREQEAEAKRTAADRKRKDLEKKQQDPLALNYIK